MAGPGEKTPLALKLPFSLKPGMVIRINLKCCDKLRKDFTVKIEDDTSTNTVLYTRYKSLSKQWVFNAKENGKWHTEETLIMLHNVSEVHLRPNEHYTFSIQALEDIFTIGCSHFNPNSRTEGWQYKWNDADRKKDNHVNNYKHRKNLETATHILIEGSVTIDSVIIHTAKGDETIFPVKSKIAPPETPKLSVVTASPGVVINDSPTPERKQASPTGTGSPVVPRAVPLVVPPPISPGVPPSVPISDAEHVKKSKPSRMKSFLAMTQNDEIVGEENMPKRSSMKPNREGRYSSTVDKEPIGNLIRIGDKWVPEPPRNQPAPKKHPSVQTADFSPGLSAITPVIGPQDMARQRTRVSVNERKSDENLRGSKKVSLVDIGKELQEKLKRRDTKDKAGLNRETSTRFNFDADQPKAETSKDGDKSPEVKDSASSEKLRQKPQDLLEVRKKTLTPSSPEEVKDLKKQTKESRQIYEYYREPRCWCQIS